jgi:hypothetical protein
VKPVIAEQRTPRHSDSPAPRLRALEPLLAVFDLGPGLVIPKSDCNDPTGSAKSQPVRPYRPDAIGFSVKVGAIRAPGNSYSASAADAPEMAGLEIARMPVVKGETAHELEGGSVLRSDEYKMSNSKAAPAEQGKRIVKLAVTIAACVAFGATMALAKGGTAKPPNPKNPPPPVGILPAPSPLTRLTPATVKLLTPPSPAADAAIHGFDVTGFVKSYDASACAGGGSGGNVTINGTKIVIPCNLIIQMPANTITWADFVSGLEAQVSPEPYDLASISSGSQNPSFELHLVGNVVNRTYIAALGFASQQSVNSGTGVISSIEKPVS